jgi:hypothetical protein
VAEIAAISPWERKRSLMLQAGLVVEYMKTANDIRMEHVRKQWREIFVVTGHLTYRHEACSCLVNGCLISLDA